MRTDLLDQYEKQVEVEYKGEKYLVRDNGAVCRTSRPEHRKRTLDDVWCVFRTNAITHSGGRRSLIPEQGDHSFRAS
jgi:hypothetical protein